MLMLAFQNVIISRPMDPDRCSSNLMVVDDVEDHANGAWCHIGKKTPIAK